MRASSSSSLPWSHFVSVTIQIVHLSCLNALLLGREASLVLVAFISSSPWGPDHAEPSPPPQAEAARRPGSTGPRHFWELQEQDQLHIATLQRSASGSSHPNPTCLFHRLCGNLRFSKRGALTQISPAELHGGIPSPELTAQAGLLGVH